jgi:hypothetical protein
MSKLSDTHQRSFGQLATRISAWTTRALLTAVVAVAALGFGRQVIRWWRVDTVGPVAPGRITSPSDGFGSLDHLHMLQFGNSRMSFARQTVTGPKAKALKVLQNLTRDAACGAGFPTAAASDSERRFLSEIVKHRPADQQPGQWWLYQVDNRLPAFVGIRTSSAGGAENGKAALVPGVVAGKTVIASAAKGHDGTDAEEILRCAQNDKGAANDGTSPAGGLPPPPVAPSACRVVTWGLAVPMNENAWTLYVFSPGGHPTDRGSTEEIPIPPGSDRILSMRVAGGGQIISFKARATPELWTRFYDRWLAASNWRPHGGWQRSGPVWGLHCGSKAASAGGALDVEFVDGGTGQLTGLLLVAPAAPSTDGKKDP